MSGKRYWWPLELTAEMEVELTQYKNEMAQSSVPLNQDLALKTDRMLIDFLAKPVRTILARDSLPYLGHVFVGWGNATVDGHPLLDRVAPFVHLDQAGKPYIYQCHPEGDFHPFQTFAYSMMAGVDPDSRVGNRPFTLREIAQNCTVVRTSDMTDLGHMLFSFAEMKLPATTTMHFNGQPLNLPQMMEQAVHAHHFGSFFVCRKYHLTEGLCAAAKAYPELAHYQGVAQQFLDGQMDVMLTLSMLIKELELVASGATTLAQSRIPALRKALLIGSLLENKIYSAGHVIELAALALRIGYQISPSHRNALQHILNHLNGCILRSLGRFSPMPAVLPLGHYRRALTLYSELLKSANTPLARPQLAQYTANFDTCGEVVFDQTIDPVDDLYTRAAHAPNVRPYFQSVLDEFSQDNSTGMELYGGFDHFRRLHPDGWPRQVHFEFLDYANQVGVELHFENPDLLPLMDRLCAEIPALQAMFPGMPIEGLRRTDRTEAKIRLFHSAEKNPAHISRSMHDFVSYMKPIVSRELALQQAPQSSH